jgi:lipopolysaccharide/colanic/teichoic acid biosynthesis glycosyltransferase
VRRSRRIPKKRAVDIAVTSIAQIVLMPILLTTRLVRFTVRAAAVHCASGLDKLPLLFNILRGDMS